MLRGSIVAIVTPMTQTGAIDFDALHRLVDFHIENQTDGIVIVGTTGESPTVDITEHRALIEKTVHFANGKIPVIAGTGANSTQEAIELTRFAKEAGAVAGLSVVPYYNKPTQEGMYQHFKSIAEAVDLPLVLYNVPGRTGCDMQPETVRRLAQVQNIIGIKEATGNIERASALIYTLPEEFAVYSGDDASCLALMLLGGAGVISVTANVAPRAMHDLCVAAFAGDLKTANTINSKLFALHQKLFVEANPIPTKWALIEMGLIGSGVRLPLTPLSSSYHDIVRDALKQAGCL